VGKTETDNRVVDLQTVLEEIQRTTSKTRKNLSLKNKAICQKIYGKQFPF
jgi:hypothetical protein